jgi:NADPH-dependent dioxygenase
MVDQVKTEAALRDALAEMGVKVEQGVSLEELDPGDDGAGVLLRHAGGRTESFRVPWLVGADGAHSTVRRALGLRLLGEQTQTWLNADVVIDADLQRNSNHLLHTGKGTILLVPFPEPGKWRAVDTVDVSGAEDWELIRSRLAGKLSQALRRPVAVESPTWVSVFTVQQRMIERMRVGRCFVAGDAAHVHSPASGQGMNTGIQDGYNLAWKLADVVRGYADARLLDTYGAERVPIGAKLLRSTRTATGLVALRNTLAPIALPIGARVLNTLKPLKRRIEGKIIRGFCGLALHYADSPLTAGPASRPGTIPPGHRVACNEAEFAAHPGWRDLVEELRDPRWTLLGFGDDALSLAVLDDVSDRFGGAVSVRRVTAGGPAGAATLGDPSGVLRDRLGAPAQGYALIRPDGYLAGVGHLLGGGEFGARLREYGLVAADGVAAGTDGEAH